MSASGKIEIAECEHVERTHRFADGEVEGAEADAAREHLVDCAICQAELADLMQLAAAVADAGPAAATTNKTEEPKQAPIVSLAWYRRKKALLVGGVAMAAAAAATLVLVTNSGTRTGREGRKGGKQPSEIAMLELGHARQFEGRIAWSGASAYRPYDVNRGGADDAHEGIPLTALAALETKGDLRGVAMAYLLNGDARQAKAYLAKAKDATADDRAVVALAAHDPAAALALADEAIARHANDRAAQWNRALALRDLGLSRDAAAQFRAIAAHADDQGWASEAKERADKLDREWDARDGVVKRVIQDGGAPTGSAGSGSAGSGSNAGLTPDDARALPGLTRLYFYDALRTAPSRDAVLALTPVAQALDTASGSTELTAALARVAALDFTQRAPLAATYARILANDPPTGSARAAYLAKLRASPANADLLVGALVKLGDNGGRDVLHAELPEFTKLAGASPDPWFRLLAVEQQAIDDEKRGDLLAAEALVRPTLEHCTIPYRCARLGMFLADTYHALERTPDARTALAAAWKTAHAAGETLIEQALLSKLASANVDDDATGSGLPLARAYAAELRLRVPAMCQFAVEEHELLADAYRSQFRRADARAELAAADAIDCPAAHAAADVVALFNRADVATTRADVDRLAPQLAAARAEATAWPETLAFYDATEARALSRIDPAAAEPLARRAIARADQLLATKSATDIAVRRARAYAYADLILIAAKANDAKETLARLAAEVGNPTLAGCALGIAIDNERRAFVVRAADQALHLVYDEANTHVYDPATLVPAPLVATLKGCATVDVIARAPIHGLPHLLPDELAWRYVSPRPRPVGTSAARSVLVADAEPPVSLELPRLDAWQAPAGTELVTGANATPQKVLAAIADAGEVVIDVHGIVDQGGPDASFLALSPDPDGTYALTPSLVRTAHLRGNPTVVLAACHGSKNQAVMHEPWSLPAAFVYAGARAVIASPEPMPDREATAFFTDLHTALANGTSAAVALRDTRRKWLAAGKGVWVRDLLVFE